MTTWILCNYESKAAVTTETFTKDGVSILFKNVWRSYSVSCQSDTQPLVDLANSDGYSPFDDDCHDWELVESNDGDGGFEFSEEISEDEVAQIEEAWEEEGAQGLEELGWEFDDSELIFTGLLLIRNEETGEEIHG
jgi:hypothetical protein